MSQPSPEEMAGLYASFETAADAIAHLAARGLEVEVDVHHPTFEELAIEVGLA